MEEISQKGKTEKEKQQIQSSREKESQKERVKDPNTQRDRVAKRQKDRVKDPNTPPFRSAASLPSSSPNFFANFDVFPYLLQLF